MMAQPADSNDRPDFLERHYTVGELSKSWHMVPQTVRLWFENEPGVLRLANKRPKSGNRTYVQMRIPESVARRVYLKRTNRKAPK